MLTWLILPPLSVLILFFDIRVPDIECMDLSQLSGKFKKCGDSCVLDALVTIYSCCFVGKFFLIFNNYSTLIIFLLIVYIVCRFRVKSGDGIRPRARTEVAIYSTRLPRTHHKKKTKVLWP